MRCRKILFYLISFSVFITLGACGEYKDVSKDFIEGSLLFDMGANSIENVEYCKIIDEDSVTEILVEEEEFNLFAKYRYKEVYPLDKLHELTVFPNNKRINISIEGDVFVLYLMEDASIVVNIIEEEGYRLYAAEKEYQITSEKYDDLVKEYGK